MIVVLVPIAAYFKHGTGVTWVDLLVATKPQFLSGLLAGAVGLLVKLMLGGKLPLIPYLFVGVGAVLGIYAWILSNCHEPEACLLGPTIPAVAA